MTEIRTQLIVLGAVCAIAAPVFAQGSQNSFFGSALPGNVPSAANPPATGGGGDYSDDEKRMQKKFKASVNHAKELLAKGEAMMKKGETKNDDKMYKKGKILKEIAEKRLNELQANNPFPDTKGEKGARAEKEKKADGT